MLQEEADFKLSAASRIPSSFLDNSRQSRSVRTLRRQWGCWRLVLGETFGSDKLFELSFKTASLWSGCLNYERYGLSTYLPSHELVSSATSDSTSRTYLGCILPGYIV